MPSRGDDLHVIRFSAGTTGFPKGIVHTVAAWLAIGNEYRWCTPQIDERDSYLAAGPLTHAAVLFLWPMLQMGGSIVVMPAFDPGRALELIESQRITFTLMVPTMIQALLGHPDARRRDLSSLRCLNYGAAPISVATVSEACDVLGEVLYQLYGQSEAVPITMLLAHQHRPHGTPEERRWLRSVGRATPNTTITIVDDDGSPLPQGETGEVAVLSPGGMKELWRDPEGTRARRLDDGSVLTRDIGALDEDGFLYLLDRKEDMIISGGFNIWPSELEHALASHPAVREVCVVGVPHPRWGETPKAVVVVHAGASVTETELIALCRERVGPVKKVTSVDFVAELPRSGIGKILRRTVREPFWSAADSRIAGA
jgi:acyl-CoA synthetase (AMP-forming)/AMP-acid ligase II